MVECEWFACALKHVLGRRMCSDEFESSEPVTDSLSAAQKYPRRPRNVKTKPHGRASRHPTHATISVSCSPNNENISLRF